MEQLEKVCKGLECCDAPNDHEHCPYDGERHYNICTDKLLKDALALIRQQQERIEELEEAQRIMVYQDCVKDMARVMTLEEVCGWTKGEPLFIEEDRPSGNFSGYNVFHFSDYQYVCFTPHSGDDAYFPKEDYGLTWRCWTQRPTEAEREAAKWDE